MGRERLNRAASVDQAASERIVAVSKTPGNATYLTYLKPAYQRPTGAADVQRITFSHENFMMLSSGWMGWTSRQLSRWAGIEEAQIDGQRYLPQWGDRR